MGEDGREIGVFADEFLALVSCHPRTLQVVAVEAQPHAPGGKTRAPTKLTIRITVRHHLGDPHHLQQTQTQQQVAALMDVQLPSCLSRGQIHQSLAGEVMHCRKMWPGPLITTLERVFAREQRLSLCRVVVVRGLEAGLFTVRLLLMLRRRRQHTRERRENLRWSSSLGDNYRRNLEK